MTKAELLHQILWYVIFHHYDFFWVVFYKFNVDYQNWLLVRYRYYIFFGRDIAAIDLRVLQTLIKCCSKSWVFFRYLVLKSWFLLQTLGKSFWNILLFTIERFDKGQTLLVGGVLNEFF